MRVYFIFDKDICCITALKNNSFHRSRLLAAIDLPLGA